jgi:hypothetical protein
MEKADGIFFWIPKTGGYSIYEALVKHGCIRERWLSPFVPFTNEGLATFGHVDMRECLARGVVSQDYFDRAFKFCFVRNPWDRLVSLYFYKRYNEQTSFDDFVHRIQRAFAARRTLCGRAAARSQICQRLLARFRATEPYILVPPIGPFNSLRLSQANVQADWVTDSSGNLVVDFVGKFENLSAGIETVFERLGIDEELGHKNKTQHKSYRTYYTTETRGIVGQLYRRDVELFGYAF